MGSLQRFIAKRRSDGVKTRSINNALALVRHILNLVASEWRYEQGLTWLEYAPKIKLIPVKDGRAPYPLARDEAGDTLPGVAQSPRTNGVVQGGHGMPRSGGVRPQVGR